MMTDEPLTAEEARERTPRDTLVLTERDLDDVLQEVVDRLQDTPDDVNDERSATWVASGIDTARHMQAAVEAAGRHGRAHE